MDLDGNNVFILVKDKTVMAFEREGESVLSPEWIALPKILLLVQHSWQAPLGFEVSPSPVDEDCNDDDRDFLCFRMITMSKLSGSV